VGTLPQLQNDVQVSKQHSSPTNGWCRQDWAHCVLCAWLQKLLPQPELEAEVLPLVSNQREKSSSDDTEMLGAGLVIVGWTFPLEGG